MTARLYKSTDASAPVLTGVAGSLVAVLDAVLVNGYGSTAAAGWTKPYTATNKAVYRNSAVTGTGFCLDLDDSAPVTAMEARARGYEAMTATGTGTGPFPTVAQMATGLFIRKSATASTVARPWYILADETVFYLFVESGDYTAPTRATAFCFGDFYSYKAGDAYRCQIMGRDVENTGSQAYERFPLLSGIANQNIANQTTAGHYLARGITGVGGAIAFGVHGDAALQSISSSYPSAMGQSANSLALAYPNPADNGLYMAPAYLHHSGGGLRGYLKGLWCPSHDAPLGHLDTFAGTGALAAKAFLVLQMFTYNGSNNLAAQAFLETSNTWS